MRFRFLAQRSDRPLQQHLQLGVLVRGEVLDVTGMAQGHDQHVPRVVRELVQHHVGQVAPRQDALGLSRRHGAEDATAVFLELLAGRGDVLHAPRLHK